jgi:hypothetical protein
MRTALGVLLFLVAGALAMVSYGALQNLWGNGGDSGAAAYILIGGIELAAAITIAWLGARLLRS